MINNIEERLKQDEWNYLINKYPNVAFNFRNFNGSINSSDKGFNTIYIAEPYTNMSEQWDERFLRQYKKIITYNEKFYNTHRSFLNMRLVKGCIWCNSYYQLDSFKKFDEKYDSICILNKLYYLPQPVGNIMAVRQHFAENFSYPIDIWASEPWGGSKYKGSINAPHHHSHTNHLQKINEYKFCACFESTYHEYWSWGFITERILNCFKAKTIPIYIGCYNIEHFVPSKYFIDFRRYFRNYNKLYEILKVFSKQQYEDIVEEAFQWVKTQRIGNVEDLEKVINE